MFANVLAADAAALAKEPRPPLAAIALLPAELSPEEAVLPDAPASCSPFD